MGIFNDHQPMTMSLTAPSGEHYLIEKIPWDEGGTELVKKFTCLMKLLSFSDGAIVSSLRACADELQEELDCESETFLEDKAEEFIDLRNGILKKKDGYFEPEPRRERWYDSLMKVRRFVIENDSILEKPLTREDIENETIPPEVEEKLRAQGKL